MGGNLSRRSRIIHLDFHARNTVNGLVGYSISVEILFISRIYLTIISVSAFVVYHALPVLVLGNCSLGGFGGVAADEITAGHLVVLRMLLVGISAVGYGDLRDSVLTATFVSGAYAYLDAIQGFTFQAMARSCLEVVVHDVDLSTARTTVAGTLRIIHHAVAEVNVFSLYGVLPLIGIVILVAGIACPSVSGTIESWTSVHEMSYEVVVEAG